MRLTTTMARIYLENCGESFDCDSTQNVLRAMECLGRKGIPVGCRGGGCGVCKVRVLRGNYRTEKMSCSCVSEEQHRQGFALACRLFPGEGDLHLQVVGAMQRALQPSAVVAAGSTGN
jgi:ferredoxin